MFKPSGNFFCDRSKAVLLLLIPFCNCFYYTGLSVYCSLMITCRERSGLLELSCVMFSCVFVTFRYMVSGQVWYLIVSISDLCLRLYFQDCDYRLTVKAPITTAADDKGVRAFRDYFGPLWSQYLKVAFHQFLLIGLYKFNIIQV